MANDVIKLTWAADGEADEAELNLLDFVQGLTLADGGWIPQVATGDQATVTETMTFRAQAMSHDQLAGYVQVLDDWIVKVGWSLDFTQRQFVWLNARWKSEAGIRRAPVFSLSYSLGGNESSPFAPYVRDDSFVPTLTIVIVRGAYWESPTSTLVSETGISSTGGAGYFITGANYIAIGDVPSRIRIVTIAYTNSQRYTWIGFRSSRNGVLANFVPVWDLKFGALYGVAGDTATTADATAHSGTRVTTNFASKTTLYNRIIIATADVTANYADQRGMYICLLRAKMSDTSIARARASSGFVYNNSVYYVNPRVTIQGTSWNLYSLGLVRIPVLPRESASTVQKAAISLDAELVSGSGSLYWDCLILIPYNDAYIDIDLGSDSTFGNIVSLPDSKAYSYSLNNLGQASVDFSRWNLPANNEAPLMVTAGQSSTDHDLTDTMQMTGYIVPRWRTLRGSE